MFCMRVESKGMILEDSFEFYISQYYNKRNVKKGNAEPLKLNLQLQCGFRRQRWITLRVGRVYVKEICSAWLNGMMYIHRFLKGSDAMDARIEVDVLSATGTSVFGIFSIIKDFFVFSC